MFCCRTITLINCMCIVEIKLFNMAAGAIFVVQPDYVFRISEFYIPYILFIINFYKCMLKIIYIIK